MGARCTARTSPPRSSGGRWRTRWPSMVETVARWSGTPVRRVEDPRLLTGTSRFVDDLDPGGLLHVAFAPSPFAAARIGRIDAGAAVAVPGGMAVRAGPHLDLPGLGA